jgi:hypothetical protein
MINLEFQDGDGNTITELDIGQTYPGIEGEPRLFRLANTGDEAVSVQLYCDISEYQLGTAIETYNSSWLSLNNFNWLDRIFCNIEVDGFVEIYIKWRPPVLSGRGDKQWGVKWIVSPANVEDICDPLT